jgi:hypothetical protein
MKTFLPNDLALVAYRLSTAIPSIIGTEFFGSEIIVLKDSTTGITFLYNDLGQLVIRSQGPTVVLNKVEQRRTQVPESARRGASLRI